MAPELHLKPAILPLPAGTTGFRRASTLKWWRSIVSFAFLAIALIYFISRHRPSVLYPVSLFPSLPTPSDKSPATIVVNSSATSDNIETFKTEYETLRRRAHDILANETRIDTHQLNKVADQLDVVLDLDNFIQRAQRKIPSGWILSEESNSSQILRDDLLNKLFPYMSVPGQRGRSLEDLIGFAERDVGIVMPVCDYVFRYALHLIVMLKQVIKTDLPIVVVYAGERDLSNTNRAALLSLHDSVEMLDILGLFDESLVRLETSGFAIKPFALLASPFKQTILMDSDAVFLQDPRVMLEDPGYQEFGTLFFKDREWLPDWPEIHDWFDDLMEKRKPSEAYKNSRWFNYRPSHEEQESGVVVVDKGRRDHLIACIFVGWLNSADLRQNLTAGIFWGDKETYWMAFELAGVPYYIDPPYASLLGRLSHVKVGWFPVLEPRMCSEHHLHLDRKGRPLWWNGSLLADKWVEDSEFFVGVEFMNPTGSWEWHDDLKWCMTAINIANLRFFSDVKDDHGVSLDVVMSNLTRAALFAELKWKVQARDQKSKAVIALAKELSRASKETLAQARKTVVKE